MEILSTFSASLFLQAGTIFSKGDSQSLGLFGLFDGFRKLAGAISTGWEFAGTHG
jgi:hypothetical protein